MTAYDGISTIWLPTSHTLNQSTNQPAKQPASEVFCVSESITLYIKILHLCHAATSSVTTDVLMTLMVNRKCNWNQQEFVFVVFFNFVLLSDKLGNCICFWSILFKASFKALKDIWIYTIFFKAHNKNHSVIFTVPFQEKIHEIYT